MTDTLGQTLTHARQKLGASLEDASQVTHIRVRFLQALEADDLNALPSLVQGRGFLRLYASYLGLDEKSLLLMMPASQGSPQNPVQAAPPVASSWDSTTSGSPTMRDSQVEEGPDENISSPKIEHAGVPPSFLDRSQQIYESIGRDLRAQRELLSLSLSDIEKHTRLRTHYIKALEEGRMQDMPSFVQARGMLSNYAHFINLDSDALLLRFADALQARREEISALQAVNQKPSFSRKAARPTLPRFFSVDLVVTGGLIILLVAFVTWGASRVLNLRAAQVVVPTAPHTVDVLLSTPTSALAIPTTETAAQRTPAAETPQSGAIPPSLPASLPTGSSPGAVEISVLGLQRAWLRITVDGKVQLNEIVAPGSAYTFDGNRQIELLTGSASAFQVYYKGSNFGVLGSVGQVVDLVFTPQGVGNPTPTITPTATRTPRVTPIPTGKASLTASPRTTATR